MEWDPKRRRTERRRRRKPAIQEVPLTYQRDGREVNYLDEVMAATLWGEPYEVRLISLYDLEAALDDQAARENEFEKLAWQSFTYVDDVIISLGLTRKQQLAAECYLGLARWFRHPADTHVEVAARLRRIGQRITREAVTARLTAVDLALVKSGAGETLASLKVRMEDIVR